ncbi:MAG: acyl carrier protein [Selenomonadaceae bacterium]|nr:acyl carrier protein [Selenomonadaceae bacterium]
MTNIESYNKIFMETFNVEESALHDLQYQGVKEWDSIGHMTLISDLEDTFDIEMETDDIVDFSGYEKGKEILKKYGVEI